MFNSGILDVAIGITFVFILVSTVCSAIREGIESLLKTRATFLEYAIRELLSDRSGHGLAKSFFEHPRIHALFRGDYTSRSSQPSLFVRGRNLPSYISSKSFVAAVLDLAARGPDPDAKVQTGPLTIDGLRQNLDKLENPAVQRALVAALDSAQNDLNKVRESLEAWYDDAMDRVSGWYKRSTQFIIFLIALVVTCGLNINTITIADSLYRNQAVRDAAVAAARAHPPTEVGYDAALKSFDSLRLPIGWDGGWGSPRNSVERRLAGKGAKFEWWNDAIAPVLGLLITAFAATLGAPFWFDVLNKVMVIRATVKPHEKSPDEASEDRQSPRTAAARAQAPPQQPVIQVVLPSGAFPLAPSEPENDVDGCDAEIEHATPDETLPPATGGVSP